jgi:RNA polymerase sigma-70 factor, ECF subfamily
MIDPNSGTEPRRRRTLGDLLCDAMPELRHWILRRRWAARLGNESAGDLVQSVCREALAARAAFEDQGNARFRAWVRRLAERKLADRARHWNALRREKSRRDPIRETDHEEPVAPPESSPFEQASRCELSRRLLDAIELLPPAQRAVLELQVLEQLDTGQIARRVQRSEVAVRILRCRALDALARTLERGAG